MAGEAGVEGVRLGGAGTGALASGPAGRGLLLNTASLFMN